MVCIVGRADKSMFKLYKVRFEQDKNQYCDWARKHKRSHDACGGGSRRTGGFAGLPFVGPAGKLLDLLLKAMRIKEDMYYIANIVKCRPPGNRVPTDDEAEMCLPYLRNQLVLVKPRIIVCLGATAMNILLTGMQRLQMSEASGLRERDIGL